MEEWLYYVATGSIHTQKLCSRLYSTEIEFSLKKTKIVFWATLRGLRGNVRTPPITRWKARVDFIFIIIKLLSLSFTVETLLFLLYAQLAAHDFIIHTMDVRTRTGINKQASASAHVSWCLWMARIYIRVQIWWSGGVWQTVLNITLLVKWRQTRKPDSSDITNVLHYML